MDASVLPLVDAETLQFPWGTIQWLASGALGNCQSMTVGRVTIRAGHSNPGHRHATCDEVLHLLQGELEHTAGPDRSYHLNAADTIVLPAGTPHRARSVGDQDAVMIVAYPTPERDMQEAEHDAD